MKRIINFDQKRRSILFDATAREMKVSNVVIEKDFWVCAVLNYIAKDYQSMSEMIFSDKPSFEEIVNGLQELEQFLRSIR